MFFVTSGTPFYRVEKPSSAGPIRAKRRDQRKETFNSPLYFVKNTNGVRVCIECVVRSKRGHRRVIVTDYYADFEGSLKYHVERCKGGKTQAIETKGGLLGGAVDKIGSRIINDKIAAWIIEASPPLRVVMVPQQDATCEL